MYNLEKAKSMNWNKFFIASSLALTAFAVPVATAQLTTRSTAAPRGETSQTNFPAPSSARTFQAPAGLRTGGVNAARNGAGNRRHWDHGDNGRWEDHRWHHHHHRFPPYYCYYPYGYPFWGSSFYFSGYRPAYAVRGTGSIVVDVQQELARAGYYRGAIDGVLGDGTRRAIRRYESANGLPVDGRIDADLLATMGVG